MPQTKTEHESKGKSEGMDTQHALLSLIAIFLVSLSALAFVYTNFPQLEENEYQYMKLPTDIEDAKNLGRVLSHYKNRYYLEVLAGVFVTYIFLQTFAIPGSIFLSILSGFLFRWELALLVICFCSATGASFCYLLSYLAGRPVVLKYMPERTKSWQEKVDKQRDNLLFYIIFLRITPFLPNWFINITSPVINVPLMPFWFGTFLGVAPPSILAVQAGTTLYELTSSRDAFSLTSVVLLGLAACLSLVPILLKNRLREKFDQDQTPSLGVVWRSKRQKSVESAKSVSTTKSASSSETGCQSKRVRRGFILLSRKKMVKRPTVESNQPEPAALQTVVSPEGLRDCNEESSVEMVIIVHSGH